MGIYSIKELEQISGIKAHTIRMWEARFNILKPNRTQTNIRFYDENDLKLLLNISMLCCKGIKISRIAGMSEEEICSCVRTAVESCDEYVNQINALILATIDLDEHTFDKIFSTCTLRFGFEKTFVNVIYPLLVRIGIFWQTGTVNPAQEHFLSNLVRQKLISAIDGIVTFPEFSSSKFLLFLPEGELHEISLLFTAWYLKSHGQKVIYLGQSVPLEDLIKIAVKHEPQFLFTVITSKIGKGCPDEYLMNLASLIGNATLLLTGQSVVNSKCETPPNVKILPTLESLERILTTLNQN